MTAHDPDLASRGNGLLRWIGIGCSGSEAEIASSVVTAEKWESGFPREVDTNHLTGLPNRRAFEAAPLDEYDAAKK